MADSCTHIEAIDDVKRARRRECDECVKIGIELGASAYVPDVRCHALLRQLAQTGTQRNTHERRRPGDRVGGTGERWLYCYPDDVFAEY
jgi:hypothetical protein